jgi:hypothetical protein
MSMRRVARLLGSLALLALPAEAAAPQDATCGGEMGGVTAVELVGTAAGSPASLPGTGGGRGSCQAGEEVGASQAGAEIETSSDPESLLDQQTAATLGEPTGVPAGSEEADLVATASLPPLTVGRVAVGQFADIAVLSPDETLAYVTGHQEESIVVIELRTPRVLHQFPVPDKVWGLAISPNGRRLFVSSTPIPFPISDQCTGQLLKGAAPGHLFIMDALSGALIKTLPLPAQSQDLLVSPDGTRLAAVTTNGVELIDLDSEAVVASIAAPPGQDQIVEAVFAAGGTKIFAASGGQGVIVFDLTNGSAHSLVPPPGYALIGLGMSGVSSLGLVFTTLTGPGGVAGLAVIDAATEDLRPVPEPSNALGGVLFAHRQSRLFLPSSANVLDGGTFGVVGALPLYYIGTGLVGQLSPDESILYVRPVSARIDSLTLFNHPVRYDLVLIDTSSLRVLAHIDLSRGSVTCTRPTPLVLGASGQVLVAPNPALRTVSIVKACSRTHPAKVCR